MLKSNEMADEFWRCPSKFSTLESNLIEGFLDPKNRSSAIFPIYTKNGSKCCISFLNYWSLKHGNNVIMRLTLRSPSGEIKKTEYLFLEQLNAYFIDLNKMLLESLIDNVGFVATLEVEVFSKSPPPFLFPAISLMYQNSKSFSVVHSCIRIYNSDEHPPDDYALALPQTGFDILINQNCRNYFCFMGADSKSYELNLTLYANNAQILKKKLNISNENYAQLHCLFIEDIFSDSKLALGSAKLSIEHDFTDIFPRFFCGIIHNDTVPTLTHTFFNTNDLVVENMDIERSKLRAENLNAVDYFDSAFMIPVLPTSEFETELITYGQNLSFDGSIHLRIFDEVGSVCSEQVLIGKEVQNWLVWAKFNVSNFFKKNNYNIAKVGHLFVGFVTDNSNFPKRFKLGLNISKKSEHILGTNICFSPLVQKKGTMEKPFSRRWFPVGGEHNIVASLHNTKFNKTNTDEVTEVSLKFVNIYGEELEKLILLKANESILIDANNDGEVLEFLYGKFGWVMVQANTYLLDSFYFSTEGMQVGGDHGY